MGKIFEILGLITVIIFGGMITKTALNNTDESNNKALTVDAITNFIEKTSAMASGQAIIDEKPADAYDVMNYLAQHLSDTGRYKAVVRVFRNGKENKQDLNMDKNNYIIHVVNGVKNSKNYNSETTIEHIDIAGDKKTAKVMISQHEEGDIRQGNEENDSYVSVSSSSYCEQTIELSKKNTLQITYASCMSNVDVF